MLSSPACGDAWRRVGTQRFCGNECAAIHSVTRCFSSARRVIADTVIAALVAVNRRGVNSAAVPTGGTSKVPKDGSIIATASANIGGGGGKCKRA